MKVAHIMMMSSSSSSSSLIVGLNPALQKRLVLPSGQSLEPGAVHRVETVQMGIGGKGQDVATTLSCLQYRCAGGGGGGGGGVEQQEAQATISNITSSSNNFQLIQFLGTGAAGDALWEEMAQQYSTSDSNVERTKQIMLEPLTVRTASGLRTCTSIVATDSTTEMVEPSGIVTEREIQQLWQRLDQFFVSSQPPPQTRRSVAALCFMGSLPPGCPTDMYAQIYAKIIMATASASSSSSSSSPWQPSSSTTTTTTTTTSQSTTSSSSSSSSSSPMLVLIDSVVGLPALLQQIVTSGASSSSCSSSNHPAASVLLKINLHELCQLAGVSSASSKNKNNDKSSSVIVQALTAWFTQHPVAVQALQGICITDGPRTAHVALLPTAAELLLASASAAAEFRLFALPVASLESTPSRPLYPIGAGDAVAAGTLAAWHALQQQQQQQQQSSNTSSSSSITTERILPASLDPLWQGNASPPSRALLTAVSFGLATGSASCWQTENSVVRIDDVISLYTQTGRPAFVSSHAIPTTTTTTTPSSL